MASRRKQASSALAHVVAVSMGYGHERAAFGLRHLSGGEVLLANSYQGIPKKDHFIWHHGRRWYERISRLKKIPLVGAAVFEIMDHLQEIEPFYPRRDLSASTLQLRKTYRLIQHQQWCRHLVETLAKDPKPMVSTFMTPAFAAEAWDYPEDIYLVACDADISRGWVPLEPKKSRIKYFAPTGRVAERLQLYGVPQKNIFLTGFPLPPEHIGGLKPTVALADLNRRLCALDPAGIFATWAAPMITATLGEGFCEGPRGRKGKPLQVAFAVGGAGAQVDIGIALLESFAEDLKKGRIALTLIAGTLPHIGDEFRRALERVHREKKIPKSSVTILCEQDRQKYFAGFSTAMRSTDVLITKPSELSFYAGLGIPILMTPPVGSQEEYNRLWLYQVGAGADMLDPHFAHEWLWDWVHSGALARMAWSGYINAPTHGSYRIEDILRGRTSEMPELPMIV